MTFKMAEEKVMSVAPSSYFQQSDVINDIQFSGNFHDHRTIG